MPPRRSIPRRVSDSFRVIKELDLSHQYERQAGSLALLVLVVLLGVLVLRSDRLLRPPVTVLAEFEAARGLAGGDAVLFAGVPVGRVKEVALVETGRVRVRMRIDRRHRPRRDARLAIAPVNLLGDVAVIYQPGTDPNELPDDEILAGQAPENLATQSLTLREQAEEIALAGRAFLARDYAAEVAAARSATARARAAIAAARDAPFTALNDAMSAGAAVLASLDTLLADPMLDSARAGLREVSASAAPLMAGVTETRERLAAILVAVDSGQGNVGLARKDSMLRRELEATRRALDDLLLKYTGRRPNRGEPSK
jgi:ABC-type transporter Mla subunit MlaD